MKEFTDNYEQFTDFARECRDILGCQYAWGETLVTEDETFP